MASSAVERALEARDKAIQDLMEAKMAYGEVWRKLHDKSQAEARAFVRHDGGRAGSGTIAEPHRRPCSQSVNFWNAHGTAPADVDRIAASELSAAGVVTTRRQPSCLADDRQLLL